MSRDTLRILTVVTASLGAALPVRAEAPLPADAPAGQAARPSEPAADKAKGQSEEDKALRGVPAELRDLAERLKKVDRSDPSMPWEFLRDYKSQYHLFNPTPRGLRREFITDRPDKTINPVTVDAGHFQVETDLVIATFDRRLPRNLAGVATRPTGAGGFFGAFPTTEKRKDEYVWLLTNLRIGLLNDTELQIFGRPFEYLRSPSDAGGPDTQALGFGDMRALLKTNLWGNEGGVTALAAVGFLDLPTGEPGLSTRSVEGGASLAFLYRLPGKTYIGVELGADFRRNQIGEGYHLEVPESISLAAGLTDDLSGKVEFASVLTTDRGTAWFGVFAVALLYNLGDDLQVDVGINIGLTPNAPDWQPYLGVAKRF